MKIKKLFNFQVLKHTIDWISSTSVDTYNIYQDCYENDESNFFQKSKKISNEKRKKFRFRRRSTKFGQKMTKFFDSLEKSEEDTAVNQRKSFFFYLKFQIS